MGRSAQRHKGGVRRTEDSRGAECPVSLMLRAGFVIAGLTRNPVVARHWIPDRVRDDQLASEFSDNRPVLGKNLQ